MPVSERQAEHAMGSTPGRMDSDVLNSPLKAAALTPTAAWSRRVRWIGGLIQAAFAAFWLVRGSAVIGGGVGDVLIAVSGVAAIGTFFYAVTAARGTAPGPRVRRASGSSARSQSRPWSSSPRRSSYR